MSAMMSSQANLPTPRVLGPDGNYITWVDLPSPDRTRWVARRKAAVVAAIDGGLISLDEACARYRLTLSEVEHWRETLASRGLRGLRVRELRAAAGTRVRTPPLDKKVPARRTAGARRTASTLVDEHSLQVPSSRLRELIVILDRIRAAICTAKAKLTETEFEILTLLALCRGSPISKPTLLDYLYGARQRPDHTIINVFIAKLRRKLTAVFGGEIYITTVPGRGWALHGCRSRATDEGRGKVDAPLRNRLQDLR